MPVESATFLSQLVATNPELTDPLSQGQAQITLIKSVLQNTFPGFNAAITLTPAQLNGLPAAVAAVTAAAATAPNTTGMKLTDPVSGDVFSIAIANGQVQFFMSNAAGDQYTSIEMSPTGITLNGPVTVYGTLTQN